MKEMSEKFLYRGSVGLRSVGVPPGKFIRITQGYQRHDCCILHSSDSKRGSVDESFDVYDSEPEALIGSAIYKVRMDGTLMRIREDWDSGD
mgnify:CR=1 FL=1